MCLGISKLIVGRPSDNGIFYFKIKYGQEAGIGNDPDAYY